MLMARLKIMSSKYRQRKRAVAGIEAVEKIAQLKKKARKA
jgi:hypothetical protein